MLHKKDLFRISVVSSHPLMRLQLGREQLHLCAQLFPYQGYLHGIVQKCTKISVSTI